MNEGKHHRVVNEPIVDPIVCTSLDNDPSPILDKIDASIIKEAKVEFPVTFSERIEN